MKNFLNYKTIWGIFDKDDKLKFASCCLLILASTIFEIIGISLIIPFSEVIFSSNHSLISSNSNVVVFLSNVKDKFGISVIFILLVLIFLTKSLFLTFNYSIITKFSFNLQGKLSHRLYKKYILENYTEFIKKKSSEIIRNIIVDTELFTINTLLPSMVLISELSLVVAIITFLFFLEPILMILIIILTSIILFGSYRFLSKILKFYGQVKQKNENLRINELQQSIRGIRDIKIFSIENFMLNNFSIYNTAIKNVRQKQEFFNHLPRIWIELFAVIFFSIIMIIVLKLNSNIFDTITLLSVFAFATFRLLPSLNRIALSMNGLKYGDTTLKNLSEELRLIRNSQDYYENKEKYLGDNFTLKGENVSFGYPNSKKNILENINFNFKNSDKVAVIGKSGSGKSTFLDLISGFLKTDQGNIYLNNKNLINDYQIFNTELIYLSQNIFIKNDTLLNNIAFGVDKKFVDQDKITKLCNILKISEFINDINFLIAENGDNLSGGQKQRIAIARALYFNPKILIMDESTNAMDSDLENYIIENIFNYLPSSLVIISTHNDQVISKCNVRFSLNK